MARRHFKKPVKKSAAKSAQSNPNRNLQIAAGVVILLVLIGIIWAVTANRPTTPAAAAPTDVADAAEGADAPEGAAAPAAKQYDSAPPMTIDPTGNYTATVEMEKGGQFVIELYPQKAPVTVNSFVFLAQEGYFNGVTFHRVLDGFMAQGGDPTGTGMGGPGYEFINEDSDLTFDKPGVVAMANAGRDTNGSQFFITFVPTEQLNGGYTIFGQVIEGMDVVNGITRRDPEQNPSFSGDVIKSVTITGP